MTLALPIIASARTSPCCFSRFHSRCCCTNSCTTGRVALFSAIVVVRAERRVRTHLTLSRSFPPSSHETRKPRVMNRATAMARRRLMKPSQTMDAPMNTPATRSLATPWVTHVRSALRSGEYDCWHFTGHGSYNSPDPNRATIHLANKEKLYPDD